MAGLEGRPLEGRDTGWKAGDLVPTNLLPFDDLELFSVLFYYDGPKVFSLYSKNANLYLLVTLVYESDTGEEETYLYLPLIPSDYNLIVEGKVTILDGYLFAIDGKVWVMEVDHQNFRPSESKFTLRQESIRAIDKDWFPKAGVSFGQ